MGAPINKTLPIEFKTHPEERYRDILLRLEVPPKNKSVRDLAMDLDREERLVERDVEFLIQQRIIKMGRRPKIGKHGTPQPPKWCLNRMKGVLAIDRFESIVRVRKQKHLYQLANAIVNQLGGIRKYDGKPQMLDEIAAMLHQRSDFFYEEDVRYLRELARLIREYDGPSDLQKARRSKARLRGAHPPPRGQIEEVNEDE